MNNCQTLHSTLPTTYFSKAFQPQDYGPQAQVVIASELAGNPAKVHVAHCSGLLVNTTMAALESEAALGLAFSVNPAAKTQQQTQGLGACLI